MYKRQGITRARRHLALSWAKERVSTSGKLGFRRPSRFLAALGVSEPRPVRKERRSTPGPAVELPVGGSLLERLRAWRLARSRADGVPAYVPANDATLAAIAEQRPSNEAELLRVPGIGPGKVAKYGEEILEIVAEED